jgi:hypothetical protein
MAFGSGFERLEVQKRFRGVIIPQRKLFFCLFWAPPIVHTPFTGVACWKLKGLRKGTTVKLAYIDLA